ncbi:LuxR C-terminal-related transcriptional regulator [Paraburkholderia sp. CNPSo 3274]|uniref:LuxR C-terminal-related transcriptional regulator n=1 Tax=Paraburkholderia sp. CNPSo 3274 TaxID=2940932 RepID=UPI0020B8855E|nr:LuxR C-terminal-related transcriptional regulator [Paraburkholderia sp. CNPSo 3274]MCP3709314.1 LuxR C-terminal-related transcriptional regulator [Paraburkholderia sp. CNPSo 3274]
MHVTEASGAVTGGAVTARPPVLLATKIFPPRLPAGLIDRPRLVCLAGQAENKRLTVIKAPAGFGKTSLALTWLERLRMKGILVAWLSLDSEDDEPARFLYHLAQALQQASDNVGASAIGLTTAASLVPAQSIVSTLINELFEVDDEVCIFLDDFHLISLPAIHDAVSFLVENAPSHVHVVICTRTDPPLPLGRLRARNSLLELDASTLRFDFDETRSFVEHEWPGKLHASSIKSLFTRTEGWAAALRISASVLARAAHKPDTEIAPASGASHPFAAYLEDMVRRLPGGMVEFMLRTSILERLSAPLCEAITGVRTSQAMLESIAARQLLLEPLDLDGTWFRFHHLMGEYLHRRLQTQHRDEVADLHRRACQWYAQEALWTDAVRHAIAAGDTEEAVSLIGRCAMALVTKGDLLTLLGWQRQFPAHLMRSQIKVTLAIAWGMALAMRFDEALAMLDTIEQDAAASSSDPDPVHWECQAIRSVVAALQDDAHACLALAESCLKRPSTDIWTTNVASNVVRFAHWKMGNLEALYAVPWVPYSIEEDSRNVFASVYRLTLLGHVEMQQLHFPLAERYFQESMRLAEQHAGPKSIAVAQVAPMIGQLRYEQGRLDEAEALVSDLMPVIDAAVLLDSALMAYRMLIRTAGARSDTVQAYALIDRAQALAYARKWDRLSAGALVERTRLNLAEGRIVEAAASVAQLDRLADSARAAATSAAAEIGTYRGLARAYLAMAQGRTQDAADTLNAELQTIQGRHGHYLALRLRTVLALAWMAASESARAVEIFREVLMAAAPAGLYQSIVDQGPQIVPLLQAVREALRGEAQAKALLAYVDRLLDGSRALYQPGDTRARNAEREPLSARERDIIGLIAHGQSNKEIARTLGIAPETVKSHVKSIFVKLAVDKRAQAVARAQSLGLVGSV